ncbi:MAG TPA: GNAT family N-acetyltransferase [Anaerolineales bacterium]|nr:GNAT family N-acetyltransferase [Anaerolineales bacterium]HMX19144.1 GNAT family N-acetyltransferase [Anaerolineales bacterium]HMX74140.1 GNAT family N-acetyltransferase [Anaerolineales bacterium]HMZ42807.1 GNAT family N-acetyltransferase [Anaerolineales bacterium]HNA53167.1 GNAT family N-acetyltransferase [Anaerolineales bacterium]
MSKLIPMTQTEFDAFLEQVVPDYAADNVKAGYWSEEEALEKSRSEFMRLLPQGLQSENHYLYTLYDEDQAVGRIWMRANFDRPTKSGFVFELWVDEQFRGKGYGKQAMLLLEEKAREMGLKSIGLHVFGYNTVARGLYEKLGYEVSSLNMSKNL